MTALVQTSLAGSDSLCLQITFGFPKWVRTIFVPCPHDELPLTDTTGPSIVEPLPPVIGGAVSAPALGFGQFGRRFPVLL